MPEPIIVALISGFFIAIGAVIGGLFSRKKNDADAAKAIMDAAKTAVNDLMPPLNKKIDELGCEIAILKRQIARYGKRVTDLMTGIEQLVKQVIDLGHKPIWTPGYWDPDSEDDE